ncbi:hypothetical protein QN355_11255 [Cryobacterium sp. 10S3]|uniref:hypothetical protein n=1 Tax=Cryobacterium sp. 10S3 TaxID=3048582 RepID=UPI002AC8D075|nr:hypothetical protein [Cryobacterium sp. 10S3]MEB0287130.1 hypothetical protein [Cryobacterium sp. 10S3]WPX12267.1 hypothetical protein RHM57_11295 [Cryobacterium sp. 10S3]
MTEDPVPGLDDSSDTGRSIPEPVHVSVAAVRRLAETVARLANDPEYFLEALTDMVLAMEPISREKLTENEVRFLVESGAFTPEEWAETSASVDRGSLQLSTAEAWLLGLFSTMSVEDVTGFLGWNESDVSDAAADGRLYAIEVSGRRRFPVWQFDAASPSKLLPGLTSMIGIMTPRWHWQSAAGFMATPQRDLVALGRKTPIQWLRDGGDVDDVREIVEASDWS